jgi:predicted nucleic acid-binding protein
MIHSTRFTCVLDTCVIYPVWIRDILLWFAHEDLYNPKWSKHIFDEYLDVLKRKGQDDNSRKKAILTINSAFPDAMVLNYEPLIQSLNLPDKKDRHVLAAAIKTNANLIVTNNIKDFPRDYLSSFGLTAKTPDDFLTDIIDLNHKKSVEAFMQMVMIKKRPAMDEYEVLDMLRNCGLRDTADYLHSLI